MFSVSKAVVGLVLVIDLRAERTRCVGSLMKCLAVRQVSCQWCCFDWTTVSWAYKTS